MIRKLSLALLILISSLTMKPQDPIPLDDFDLSEYTLHIPDSQVRTRNITSRIKLLCDKEGFSIQNGNTIKRVASILMNYSETKI